MEYENITESLFYVFGLPDVIFMIRSKNSAAITFITSQLGLLDGYWTFLALC